MHEAAYVMTGASGLTARCFGCRNRYGLVNLLVLAGGVLFCRRCWAGGGLAPSRTARVQVLE